MDMRMLRATLPMLVSGALLTRGARADDHCELLANLDFTGPAATLVLPPVVSTLALGAPRENAWANTSRRFSASDLAALDNQTSAVRVRALDSDVALYLLDGGDLNGKGNVFFCKQGFLCTLAGRPGHERSDELGDLSARVFQKGDASRSEFRSHSRLLHGFR